MPNGTLCPPTEDADVTVPGAFEGNSMKKATKMQFSKNWGFLFSENLVDSALLDRTNTVNKRRAEWEWNPKPRRMQGLAGFFPSG